MRRSIKSDCRIEVKTIEIHDLVPRGHKVADKLLLGIFTRINFRLLPLGIHFQQVHKEIIGQR